MKYFLILSFFLYLSLSAQNISQAQWLTVEPHIKIDLKGENKNPFRVTLVISADGAKKMKISNFPDFKSSEWIAYRESFKWNLPEKLDIITVYAKFQNDKHQISDTTHYALSRNNPYKKIRTWENGYIDYSEGKLYITTVGEILESTSRYATDQAQKKAEEQIIQSAYDIIKNIKINSIYEFKDYLKKNEEIHTDIYKEVNKYLYTIKYLDIKYLTPKKVEVTGTLDFQNKGGIYDILLKSINQKLTKIEDQYITIFTSLVIDTRGFFFYPYLFPEIYSEDGVCIINDKVLDKKEIIKKGFIKYIRDPYILNDPDFHDFGENPLFINAKEIHKDAESKIVISKRNSLLITSTKETFENLTSGNIFIIVD